MPDINWTLDDTGATGIFGPSIQQSVIRAAGYGAGEEIIGSHQRAGLTIDFSDADGVFSYQVEDAYRVHAPSSLMWQRTTAGQRARHIFNTLETIVAEARRRGWYIPGERLGPRP